MEKVFEDSAVVPPMIESFMSDLLNEIDSLDVVQSTIHGNLHKFIDTNVPEVEVYGEGNVKTSNYNYDLKTRLSQAIERLSSIRNRLVDDSDKLTTII